MRVCDVCNSKNIFVAKRNVSRWPYIIMCGNCGASVGCHIDTYNPLGKMASGSLRKLRSIAHESFDKIWKSGFMTRQRAYEWIAKELLVIEEFHLSNCTHSQLLQVINISEQYCERKGQHKIELGIKKQHARIAAKHQRIADHNERFAKIRKRNRR